MNFEHGANEARVNQVVQEQIVIQQTQQRQAFYQALRTAGLVKDIKTRPSKDIQERRLVKIQGEKISRTIIEERR